MAARKEIIDFINWECMNPDASNDELFEQLLKVVEIYSERKADTVTLVNDLSDLVCSCRLRVMHNPKIAKDYGLVITGIIKSATDWNVILTEDEIKRFENSTVCEFDTEENLAEYIRTTYKQRISRPDGSIMDAEHQPNKMLKDEQEPETSTPPPPTDLPCGILCPVLDTQEARRIFGKAIEKGYMRKYDTENKFEWIGVASKGRNVQLAYLCGKIYGYQYTPKGNTGKEFPKELKDVFGIDNLQQSLWNFHDRPPKRRQKWIDPLDELFD